MNTNQLDQIRDALQRETRDIHPVGLGVDAVLRRGRRRRQRGRAAVAVGAATCIAGVGVTIMERGGAVPQRVAVGASGASQTPTPALQFRTVTGTVSGSTTHFTTAAGVTYELSTAPGVAAPGAQPDQAIYSTTDGEHWTTADQNKSWISSLSEHDGVLYAVGTAPGATAADVQYRVATSRDGGNAWSDASLPFDLSTRHASVPVSRTSSVSLASGANETVALLSETFTPDLSSIVASRTGNRANVSVRETSAGFDMLDMSSCADARAVAPGKFTDATVRAIKARAAGVCQNAPVLGTISWSEIGLSGPADLSREEMLESTDGTHWSSLPAPTVGSVDNLVAGSNGFLLLGETDSPATAGSIAPSSTTTLLHSSDARTWTPVATPPYTDGECRQSCTARATGSPSLASVAGVVV